MRIALASIVILAVLAAPVSAQELDEQEVLYSCGKATGNVSVSFKADVKLEELVTWAMGFTCKNFVYGNGVGGRKSSVTLIAPRSMAVSDAWRTFLVALSTMNLAVVPKGKVLEIVEAPQIKDHPLAVHRKSWPSGTEQVVRMIMRPEHIPVADAAAALSTMKSKIGAVTALDRSGVIVVTDYGSSIAGMRTMLAEIDRPAASEQLYSIRVDNVDVAELAPKITELLGIGGTAPAPAASNRRTSKKSAEAPATPETNTAVPSKMIVDERTNALFLLGSEAAYLRVKALVDRIDVDIGGDDQVVHMYKLQHADAEQLSATLAGLVSGVAATSAANKQGGRGAPAASPSVQGDVKFAFDKETNALLMLSSMRDFLSLRPIIRELDAQRTQVYIEAVIMEVGSDFTRKLGVSWHGGTATDSGAAVIGGFQTEDLSSLAPADALSSDGLLGGIIGPELDILSPFGITIPSVGAVFQAVAYQESGNLLSSPYILAADNQEATISIGENIPYRSGQSSVSSVEVAAAGISQVEPIARENIALTLKLTPHVNDEGQIRIDLDLEINDKGSEDFGGMGPTWTTRSMKTTVMVHDQETVVLGGLVGEKTTNAKDKVPLLGDIPVLGYLFRSEYKQVIKTNLLVVLTPHIVSDQIDSHLQLEHRMRERAEYLESIEVLDQMELDSKVDYKRKRGLIEEINQTVARYRRDAEQIRRMEEDAVVIPEGPIAAGESGP